MHTRSRKFPAFPYAHADALAKPFIHSLQVCLGVCIFEVADPPTDCIMQCFFALFITHSVTPHREQFQFGLELSKRFSMDAESSNITRFIERVTKELGVPHTARNGLFAIDF